MTAFRFGLGHVALDFVATLGRRDDAPVERLAAPGDLARWLEEAELAAPPVVTDDVLEDARVLREAVHRAVTAARADEDVRAADLDALNTWARRPTLSPQLDRHLHRSYAAPDLAEAALAHLARESVLLLSDADLSRVRTCAGCSLLFMDRSRPGQRRWCSMDRCGNRVKTARYRARQGEH